MQQAAQSRFMDVSNRFMGSWYHKAYKKQWKRGKIITSETVYTHICAAFSLYFRKMDIALLIDGKQLIEIPLPGHQRFKITLLGNAAVLQAENGIATAEHTAIHIVSD